MKISQKLSVGVAALSLCVLPATPSQACNLWKSWFGAPATTTYYAPYTAAFAPAGCGQTVNYMPQTCYRTVYVNTPVTTYQPVTACNACGGATTVMRPVVSYVMRPQLVPYTTYRPVVTAAPVMAATYYAPAAPVAVAAPAPAPCCGGGAAVAAPAPLAVPSVTTAAPAMAPAPSLAPMAAPPAGVPMGAPGAMVPSLAPPPTGTIPSANVAPSLQTPAPQADGSVAPPVDVTPHSQPGANKTFENGTSTETNKPAPQSRLLLPPSSETPSSTRSTLRGLDPESESQQDRVTAVPLRGFAVRTASAITRLPEAPAKAQDSEWRAARP